MLGHCATQPQEFSAQLLCSPLVALLTLLDEAQIRECSRDRDVVLLDEPAVGAL